VDLVKPEFKAAIAEVVAMIGCWYPNQRDRYDRRIAEGWAVTLSSRDIQDVREAANIWRRENPDWAPTCPQLEVIIRRLEDSRARRSRAQGRHLELVEGGAKRVDLSKAIQDTKAHLNQKRSS
jgi:hypothetical protein